MRYWIKIYHDDKLVRTCHNLSQDQLLCMIYLVGAAGWEYASGKE